MSKPEHILVVDDEPEIRNLLTDILEDEEYTVFSAENATTCNAALQQRRPDLILLDVWMPDLDGIALLQSWKESGALPCPVIVMSGHGTIETAVEATKLGAYEFIEKPLSLDKVLISVSNALNLGRLSRENRRLPKQAIRPVGGSAPMSALIEQALRVAPHDMSVLITGEPGTGKATLAQFIHQNSHRANKPFINAHVGSMVTREHSAIELFGSEENEHVAYGLLEQANGGTLFLGEVADMELSMQLQLLSALESGSFLRVGGHKDVPIDVRIIAATDKNLEDAIQAGEFREDLFYHLNVLPIMIPPLREHTADIPELIDALTEELGQHEQIQPKHFDNKAIALMQRHHWPGNIRELRNLIQRLLILGMGETVFEEEVSRVLGVKNDTQQTNTARFLDMPLRHARELFEREYLLAQLEVCEGSMTELAKRSGMERTNLYRKLKALNINND